MRQEQGLDTLTQNHTGRLTVDSLSNLLLENLKNCQCSIFGEIGSEENVLLAKLKVLPESITYAPYSQRIDFSVTGKILSNETPALTYQVKGDKYCFYGRTLRDEDLIILESMAQGFGF